MVDVGYSIGECYRRGFGKGIGVRNHYVAPSDERDLQIFSLVSIISYWKLGVK